jgi:hypothetical protein
MAFRLLSAEDGGELYPDENLGTSILSIIQDRPGVIQIEGVIRLNRHSYESGLSPIECLTLDDRYYPDKVGRIGETRQESLGYPACNFVNPADILWPGTGI